METNLNTANIIDMQLNIFNTFGYSGSYTIGEWDETYASDMPCALCNGSGFTPDHMGIWDIIICPDCHGDREIRVFKTYTIYETIENSHILDIINYGETIRKRTKRSIEVRKRRSS